MAKTIYAGPGDIAAHQSLTDALQLQDLSVVKHEYHDITHTLLVFCVPTFQIAICPDCGGLCASIHDYAKQRTIHDAPIRGQQTRLVFDSCRVWCERCRQPVPVLIRDVVPECTYTYRFLEEVTNPRRKQDVATLAETYGVGYKLVEGMLLKAAELKEAHRLESPLQITRLGIDEFSNCKGQGHYVLILTDLERRVLVDILPDRNKATLSTWLKQPPAGIVLSSLETVAIDLWAQYRDAVHEVFPAVTVVADRFHVMQQFNETIHTVRRTLQQAESDEDATKTLKGLRYVLIKDQSKLTDAERARLDALEQSQPLLYRLCELRQEFHDWYEVDTTPVDAQKSLETWIKKALDLGLKPLEQFCRTLKNWGEEIVNFFAHRVTSGFVEGMNSKIRVFKRIAFGIPNFAHFRLRMLWACG